MANRESYLAKKKKLGTSYSVFFIRCSMLPFLQHLVFATETKTLYTIEAGQKKYLSVCFYAVAFNSPK